MDIEPTQPPIIAKAPGWQPVYEVDFTSQPAQTIGAAGKYTIGGRTWWAKGAKGAAHQVTEIKPGDGLRFQVAGALGYQPTGDLPTGGWNTQTLYFPLSQVPINTAMPLALMFRLRALSAWPVGNTQAVQLGFVDGAESSASMLSAVRAAQCWYGTDGSTNGSAFYAGSQNWTITNHSLGITLLEEYVWCLTRVTPRQFTCSVTRSPNSWPNPSLGVAGVDVRLNGQAAVNPGIGTLLQSQTTWAQSIMAMTLQQPG